jgi:23S rRNA (adenine2030-N6)-methyltransferase
MVWYPRLQKPGAAQLVKGLQALAPQGWLHAWLDVQQRDALGFGLGGSGVLVINPPYTLHGELRGLLPWLVGVLGQHAGAAQGLEQRRV